MVNNIYSKEQIQRVLGGAGIDIEAEFGNDFIILSWYLCELQIRILFPFL